jgi:hypothetical protein
MNEARSFPPLPPYYRTPRCPCQKFFYMTFLHGTGGSTYFTTPVPPCRLLDFSGPLQLVSSLLVGKLSYRAGSANIGPPNSTLTARYIGTTLHTSSKQSTLPYGAAAQRCILQVNNHHYRVVQRRNAVYTKQTINTTAWCSDAFASLSLSLACLCLYAFLSLSLLCLSLLEELLSVCLSPCLFYSLHENSFSYSSLLLHSCLTLLLVLRAIQLAHSLSFLLAVSLSETMLCSTLSGDTTSNRLSYVLYLVLCLLIIQPTILCALLCLSILHPTILCALLCLLKL